MAMLINQLMVGIGQKSEVYKPIKGLKLDEKGLDLIIDKISV